MRGPYTKLFCHLVWATWDRLPLIQAQVEPRLHSMIRAKLREIACIPIATGGIEDHIHVLCKHEPTLCISDLVKRIKGSSSHFMNDEIVGPEGFKWQGTYGAFSVSERHVPAAKAYIMNQKAHHERNDINDDWERVWIPDGWNPEDY